MKKYLVNVNNRDLGPYSQSQVTDLIQRGYLPNFSRCQRIGENIWSSLKDMEEFSSEFSKKNSDWDEQTVLMKIKDWQREQKVESVQDVKTIQIKNETPGEPFSPDKTIISKKQIEKLRTPKDNPTKSIAAAEAKDLETLKANDKTRVLTIRGNSSEIEKAELEADKEWLEIEEIQKKKKSIKTKRGSITLIIVVLLAVFLFMPDQEDEQKNPSTTKEYILPVISFPQVYADPDVEKSAELLEMAKTINKTYSYDELLESTPLLLESYELNDANKNALYALTLNYSLMIEHTQDKADAANTVFKLLQLIGDGQEFYHIEVLTAKVYFLIFLEKFQAVKFLMDKYSAINNKVTPMLYAGYLKALIEVGDLVKARKVVEKLLPSENKVPKVYSAILDFYKNDNQDEAYWKIFNDALTKYQTSVELLLKGAHYYVKKRDIEKSNDILKRIESLGYAKSRHNYSKYLRYKGEYFALKNNPIKATEALQKSLDLEEDLELRVRLATLQPNASDERTNKLIRESQAIDYIEKSQKYMLKFDWDLAMTNALKAHSVDLNYYPSLKNLANLQSRLGYYQLAIKNLEERRKTDPNNLDLSVDLLKVYVESYKLTKAGELVSFLSQTDLVNTEYFSQIMSSYYLKKGEHLKSILWLQQSIKINPLSDKNLFLLAQTYIKANNYKVAKDLLNRAISIDSANVYYRSLYADVLNELVDTESAIGYLRQILKDLPDNVILLNKVAILYYRSGQIKNFDDLVDELKKLPEGNNDLYLYLMDAAQKDSRWADFISYAQEYLKKEPGDLNVRIALVEVYYLQNDFKSARKNLELVMQRMPTYPKVNYFEAKILLAEGKTDQALKISLVEVAENPSLEMAHILVGDLQSLNEQYNEADKSYRLAQRLNPKSVEALKGIAALKVKRNELPTAIELYKKAITWRPDDGSLHLVLGDLYRQMGQTQDAVKSYKNFLEIEPESKERQKVEQYLKSVE